MISTVVSGLREFLRKRRDYVACGRQLSGLLLWPFSTLEKDPTRKFLRRHLSVLGCGRAQSNLASSRTRCRFLSAQSDARPSVISVSARHRWAPGPPHQPAALLHAASSGRWPGQAALSTRPRRMERRHGSGAATHRHAHTHTHTGRAGDIHTLTSDTNFSPCCFVYAP